MNINWKPNKRDSKTIHHQICDYFIEQITKGHWPIGTKLPSERKLSQSFEVNRSTISTAFDELKSKGIIESKGASGTFVSNNTWSLLATSNQANWKSYLEYGLHMPNLKTIQTINKEEFGDDIIRLSTGELSPTCFPKIRFKAIMDNVLLEMNGLNYEEPLGFLPLREALVEYLSHLGIHVNVNQILITSGSLQALSLISIGLLQRGSTLFVEKPSYIKSLNVFPSLNMKYKGLEMDDEGLVLDDLKSILKNGGTNMLYTIPTLHNPTGIMMSETRRQKLLELSSEFRLPIIEDDAYRDISFNESPKPIKSYDEKGNVLYLGTLSKSFSPGLRIGWVVGPQPIVEHLGDIKMQTDYGSSSISQHIAYHWFKDGHYTAYKEELKSWLYDRMQFTMKLLEINMKELATWKEPSGGFYVWLKLKKSIDINLLFKRCLEDKVLINPGHIYDFENNNAIRLSYAYASKNDLEKGIKLLSKHIKECT